MAKGLGCLAVLLVGAAVAVAFAIPSVTPASVPAITLTFASQSIGPSTQGTVLVKEAGRGISAVTVELVQGATRHSLAKEELAAPASWRFWEKGTDEWSRVVKIGKADLPQLKEGEATLEVSAAGVAPFMGSAVVTTEKKVFQVRLTPPALSGSSQFIYVTQGGVEAVVYVVGEGATRHGVEAGSWFFPGAPLPGGQKGEQFVLFAVPYDWDKPDGLRLVAEDDVGNRSAHENFIHKFFPRPMGKDVIKLNDKFIEKVTAEIPPRAAGLAVTGTPLEKYLILNGQLRRQNSDELLKLAAKSQPGFTWKGAFLPMVNTKIMGAFADRRTYEFEGKTVDTQDHLGFDLASVAGAPVPASNDGVVMQAQYFGIFGNCVVLDHGYGVMSLYAHLSAMDVKPGEKVERGQTLGKTGATGMAGGDHLHFTMLLHGLPVNPVEWWDAHFIRDRLALKLGKETLAFDDSEVQAVFTKKKRRR